MSWEVIVRLGKDGEISYILQVSWCRGKGEFKMHDCCGDNLSKACPAPWIIGAATNWEYNRLPRNYYIYMEYRSGNKQLNYLPAEFEWLSHYHRNPRSAHASNHPSSLAFGCTNALRLLFLEPPFSSHHVTHLNLLSIFSTKVSGGFVE